MTGPIRVYLSLYPMNPEERSLWHYWICLVLFSLTSIVMIRSLLVVDSFFLITDPRFSPIWILNFGYIMPQLLTDVGRGFDAGAFGSWLRRFGKGIWTISRIVRIPLQIFALALLIYGTVVYVGEPFWAFHLAFAALMLFALGNEFYDLRKRYLRSNAGEPVDE